MWYFSEYLSSLLSRLYSINIHITYQLTYYTACHYFRNPTSDCLIIALFYTTVAVLIIPSTSLVVRVFFAEPFWGLSMMVVPDGLLFRFC